MESEKTDNEPQNDVDMEEMERSGKSTGDEIKKTSEETLLEKNDEVKILEGEDQTNVTGSDKNESLCSDQSMEYDIEKVDLSENFEVIIIKNKVVNKENEKVNNKKCVEIQEVIDVEDQPDVKGASASEDIIICDISDNKGKRCCCNLDCSTVGTPIQNAPPFVLTYYGYKYKKTKPQKVCATCFERAVAHQEHLAYMLMDRKPLLTAAFPEKVDIEVISDESDDEDHIEDLPLGKDFLRDFEEDLSEMFAASMKKYEFDYQIKEADAILTTKFNDLDDEFSKIDATVDDLQKQVDEIRSSMYKGCSPRIKELPPEDIMDVPGSPSEKRYKICIPSGSYISPTKRTYPNQSSHDSPRRPSLIGVATKKVTQVQRTVFPGLPQIEVLPAQQQQQDVVALEPIRLVRPTLPPVGALVRPRPAMHDMLYVMRHGYYGVWARGKVLEIMPKVDSQGYSKTEFIYKMKFESRKSSTVKTVTGKQLAYSNPSPVRLPVGTRVIALFRDEWAKECYYAGIVAEPPKAVNKFRYLIFFDDGYAQYVVHEKVLLVCESSTKVWEDIHPESRDFVRGYLEQYPERPMLKLQQGQIVKTEWNGKWWIARVLEVDGSLVKMHFDADGRTELIYRGSTRLGPLYSELHNADARKKLGSFGRHRSMGISSLKKRNMPYVEYTRTDIEDNRHEDSGGMYDEYRTSERSTTSRAVAKKSTSRRSESTSSREHLEALIFSSHRELNSGHVENIYINPSYVPRRFAPHQCGHRCVDGIKYDSTEIRRYNPLVLPQLHGWQRHITRCKGKKIVVYRTPCGRRVRNMEELHRYLRVSKSILPVDLFDYDSWVHCFAEFVIPPGFINIKDLSYGCENVPVPCVNDRDHTEPEYVKYSTVRLPMEGVNVNTNPEFLVSCDCVDDCKDKDKCACWQLTVQGTAYGSGGKVDTSVGYCFKRLREPVMTGIYECNSRCKCSSTCFNRVAQHPLQLRLQVFKTENRGWGIRCLNDVPHGAFICIYAGRLLTEQGANECVFVKGGKNYGDEYLAELDYIEVVERLKEGYESDVVEDDDDSTFENPKEVKKDRKERSPTDSGSEEEEEDGETSQDAHDSDFELDIKHQNIRVVPLEESTIRLSMDLRQRVFLDTFENKVNKHGSPYSSTSCLYNRTKGQINRKGNNSSTRLRNRKSRTSSTESQTEKRDVRKIDEPTSLDKELKKMEIEKKGSTDDSSSYITLSDDDDEDQREREPSRFAVMSGPQKEAEKRITYKSVREYYGDDEYCYIMDAKNDGNIGRYLNHSCTPNVFVQNVFVDTHDLRFPWVAFFALTYISAGTELTWDYNYDVGSVPGKVLHCYCGSNECRGRLL